MIEFTKLIHKETGTVIKYNDWKEKLETNNLIVFPGDIKGSTWRYNSKTILFSDDFELIYNSNVENLKEIEELKEQYKILESGNKQILEEYKITLIENLRYWKVLTWIKGQYDGDFTEDEIQELCVRDKCIYESLEEVLKNA